MHRRFSTLTNKRFKNVKISSPSPTTVTSTITLTNNKPYCCVNCGTGIDELYKKVSPSVIKIIKCDKCDNIADKYVEFEPVIILIDSVLLSKSVYRHILYNQDFKLHWKLSLVLLLLESFALWRQKLDQLINNNDNNKFYITNINTNVNINYSGEKGFYICCLQNIIDNIVLFILLYTLFTLFYAFDMNRKIIVNMNRIKIIINFFKAIIIANFSKFFLLPIMIWRDNTTEFGIILYHFILQSYYLLSLTQVCSVITNADGIHSGIIVLLAYTIKQYFINKLLLNIYEMYF